jgi:hypothetical protein
VLTRARTWTVTSGFQHLGYIASRHVSALQWAPDGPRPSVEPEQRTASCRLWCDLFFVFCIPTDISQIRSIPSHRLHSSRPGADHVSDRERVQEIVRLRQIVEARTANGISGIQRIYCGSRRGVLGITSSFCIGCNSGRVLIFKFVDQPSFVP